MVTHTQWGFDDDEVVDSFSNGSCLLFLSLILVGDFAWHNGQQ